MASAAGEQVAAASILRAVRAAQAAWSVQSVQTRLQIIRRLRQEIAGDPASLAATVPTGIPGALHRTIADTLVAEVLPLLEACRFLEREAAFLLAPQREPNGSRPLWLGGVTVETRHEALGVVLIVGPANYPLFLAGVQALQALAAGNAVLWKPAPGTEACACAVARMAVACGLDPSLITILDPAPKSIAAVLHAGRGLAPDKVILTGSAETGRAVMRELAETTTPAVMELSGCDAVFVLPGADLARVVEVVSFALLLNGSATCMAPRRLFVSDAVADQLAPALAAALDPLSPGPHPAPSSPRNGRAPAAVPLSAPALRSLRELTAEATLYGARLLLDGTVSRGEGSVHATLLDHVTPEMRIAQTDIFAPVLSILRVPDSAAALRAHRACPYALTAAVFGPARKAEELAARLNVGTVLINDLIVPTADPRASFSGRGASGFGATRGREGLLAMTQPKVILRRRGGSHRPYQPTGHAHAPFFAGFAQMLHAGPWRLRLAGLRRLVASAKHIQ